MADCLHSEVGLQAMRVNGKCPCKLDARVSSSVLAYFGQGWYWREHVQPSIKYCPLQYRSTAARSKHLLSNTSMSNGRSTCRPHLSLHAWYIPLGEAYDSLQWVGCCLAFRLGRCGGYERAVRSILTSYSSSYWTAEKLRSTQALGCSIIIRAQLSLLIRLVLGVVGHNA